MFVTIDVSTEEYYISEPIPDDRWDSGTRGLRIGDATVCMSNNKFNYELGGSIGDTCVVVVEKYSDGDTFGSSEYMDIKGVFDTEEIASAFIKSLKPPDHGYFGCHMDYLMIDAVISG